MHAQSRGLLNSLSSFQKIAWRQSSVICTCSPCCKPLEDEENNPAACPCDSAAPPITDDVPGLSEACFCERPEPLGPGASKCGDYKATEYYKYHQYSFNEAMVEMECFRQPAPVAPIKPF